ncbi:MAG: hypothetical protein J0G33_06535 [Afipia felis]|nr:hypothetical protein [Afipia felis]
MHRLGKALFLGLIAATLCAPAIGQLTLGSFPQQDNRALAPSPSAPHNVTDLLSWPKRADAYLNDHFGFRRFLVRANTGLYWRALRESTVPSIVTGRNGRIFPSAGDVPSQELLSNCGAQWPESFIKQWAQEAETALNRLIDVVPDIRIVVIPTSAVLYSDDLPRWIQRACQDRQPIAADLISRLPASIQSRSIFPLTRAQNLPELLIPKENFHWHGRGISVLLGAYMERDLGILPDRTIPWTKKVSVSDLDGMLPGANLKNLTESPDLEKANVTQCMGPRCIANSPLDGSVLPDTLFRVTAGGSNKRLLILSDSFGYAATEVLSAYFDDIINLNLNDFGRLPATDRANSWKALYKLWQPNQIIFLICDENVGQISRMIDSFLPPVSSRP